MHSQENAWNEWPRIWHADVSWPALELIKFRSQSIVFAHFGTILTKWDVLNLESPYFLRRMHGRNSLKFGILIYADHLRNWLDCGHGLLIFLILVQCWLSEMGQSWSFHAPTGKSIEGMAWNLMCWCNLTPSVLIRFWSQSIDFPHLGTILTEWGVLNLGSPCFFSRMHGRNSMKFGMLVYPGHRQNCLNFSQSVLILAQFWLNWSNFGFPGFLRRTHRRNGLKFGTLMYPDDLQNWLNFGHVLLIFPHFCCVPFVVPYLFDWPLTA